MKDIESLGFSDEETRVQALTCLRVTQLEDDKAWIRIQDSSVTASVHTGQASDAELRYTAGHDVRVTESHPDLEGEGHECGRSRQGAAACAYR